MIFIDIQYLPYENRSYLTKNGMEELSDGTGSCYSFISNCQWNDNKISLLPKHVWNNLRENSNATYKSKITKP